MALVTLSARPHLVPRHRAPHTTHILQTALCLCKQAGRKTSNACRASTGPGTGACNQN